MATMPSRERIAYFFLGRTPEGRFRGYPHQAIVFAEGLKALGWRIVSDVEAWKESLEAPYLFGGDQAGPQPGECDLLVVSEDFFFLQGSPVLPEAVTRSAVPAIFLDRRDLIAGIRDLYSSPFRRFQAIFRTHGNRHFRYPPNLRHMAFGISDRIARASFASRTEYGVAVRSGVLWNFRHKLHPHTVRLWAEREVQPLVESRLSLDHEIDPEQVDNSYDTLMLQQTEGRHFPAYYKRMARASMAACFGGWFLLPLPQQEAGPVCLWGRRLTKYLKLTTSMVAQWDSWRLWEAFAAGTAVLHVDAHANGLLFGGPLPEPMVHYIAVDVKHPERSLFPLIENPERIRQIGEAGRAWALEHYTSRPIAERMLQELDLSR